MKGFSRTGGKKERGDSRRGEESYYESLEESQNNEEIIEIHEERDKYEKIEMLDEERFIVEETFIIKDNETKLDTELYLTNYRIIIVRADPLSIPYGYILNIALADHIMKLELKTGIVFEINADRDHKDLKAYIELGINELPFCMQAIEASERPCIYDSYAEVERMRVDNKQYKVYKNWNYKFCSSYPLYFLIPKNVEVDNLHEIKKCRYSSRIPVMSYFNQKTNVGIWRAAKQFKEADKQNIKYDLAYLQQISKDIVIIELESGPAFKNSTVFQSLKILRMCYQNFVLEYYNALVSAPCSRTEQFLKAQGKWYDEVNKLISVSYYVVEKIQNSQHVLLEETYGFDRVSQVAALSSVIMDPFYRTFDGLSILIQKEFISFGHPFETRGGFNKNAPEQFSPIFIQFLECLVQLINTHPECFEYSPAYLAKIGYEVFTTKYMNFIDRTGNPLRVSKLSKCRASIWDQITRERSHHNFQFNPELRKELEEIRRKPSIKEYLTWVDYFDTICKMQSEKKHVGNPLKDSKRLSRVLRSSSLLHISE